MEFVLNLTRQFQTAWQQPLPFSHSWQFIGRGRDDKLGQPGGKPWEQEVLVNAFDILF